MKGRLILNGNMSDPRGLVARVGPWILSSARAGRSPRLLLVTAAWAESECDEAPVRAALNGIIYQMRSGCQWNHLPEQFGDDSSVHRTFQRWVQKGVLERIWATLVENCEELGGVDWRWQSADGAMGKARFGGTKSVRTPRIVRNRAPNAV